MIDIWGQIILCCEGSPVYSRLVSSTPTFCLLNVGGLHPLPIVILPNVSLEGTLPQEEKHRSTLTSNTN